MTQTRERASKIPTHGGFHKDFQLKKLLKFLVKKLLRSESAIRAALGYTAIACTLVEAKLKYIRSQPTKHVQNSTAEGGNKVRVTRLSPRNSSLWPRRARVSTRMVGSRLVHVGDKLRSRQRSTEDPGIDLLVVGIFQEEVDQAERRLEGLLPVAWRL